MISRLYWQYPPPHQGCRHPLIWWCRALQQLFIYKLMHFYHYLPMSDKSIFFFYLIGLTQDFHHYHNRKNHYDAIIAFMSRRGFCG